jgi:hypothetical protein
MATRSRFELDILCPNCGAAGNARASGDGPDATDRTFRVDEYPPGFSEAKQATSRAETLVTCRCGQVFYLL